MRSLVHSSTLVTAGVYILIRFRDLIVLNIFRIKLLFLISILTFIISCLAINIEINFKKVVALSTLKNLSKICIIISRGFVKFAILHLCLHAFSKALLFISVGVIIHETEGRQDFRIISGGLKESRLLLGLIRIAIFSLRGVPFLTLFYSSSAHLHPTFFLFLF